MQNLFERIKRAAGRLEDCIRRFPFSFVMLCLITLAANILIVSEKEIFEYPLAFTIGGLFCFLVELACEYGIHSIRFLAPLLAAAASFISYFLMKTYDNVYVYIGLAGAAIASISLSAAVLYRSRENRCLFSHVVKSAFIVMIFVFIVFSGISVCIAAFHFLIYSFDEIWKIYGVIFLSLIGLFAAPLFLSYVPRPEEEMVVPAIYRTMIHKALFYIYLLLIAILYLYIFKIVITWKMPVGKLNWFGSFALLFYVFFYLSVDEEDGKIQELFKRYGAYLLVPVLAIQLFAIFIRLNAYGLTTARFMSLILILIAISFMFSSIFHFRVFKCFLFISLVSILFTCTPLNICDVPNHIQEERLISALTEGGALIDGKLNDEVKMDSEHLEEAKSAYEYLRYSSGNKSAFFKEFEESKIAKSFYDYWYNDPSVKSFHYSIDLENEEIDIGRYQTMRLISHQENAELNEQLNSFFLSLNEEMMDTYLQDQLAYEFSDGRKIVFRYIDYDYSEDRKAFEYLYWEGILLSE